MDQPTQELHLRRVGSERLASRRTFPHLVPGDCNAAEGSSAPSKFLNGCDRPRFAAVRSGRRTRPASARARWP